MPVGEIFLSASLQVLFDRIASKSLFDFARLWELNTELEDLEQTLSDIQEVLDEAEEKQIKKPSVRRWLQELRHLAYDAEDVIDAFATEHLRCKLEMESQTTNQVLHDISSLPASFKLRYDLRSKIKKITEQFNKFAKRRERLGLTKGDGGSSIGGIQRPPTSSLVTSPNLYGRDTDVEKLIELLLSNEPIDNEVRVIPIVGMGGAGKTTLAQHLYNDERVKKHFNLKGWACVSDDFDVMRITRAILESITKRSHDLKSLDPLQSSLRDELSGKKFLLVLDDVWSKECNDWDQLRSPFRAGAQGSKVVVTTRNKDVALMMRPVSIHDLGLLSNEDCWSLFASHAFEKGNSDAYPNLVTIREKIVKKCGGLPLAAKTLGSLFYSKLKYDEWESILNSEIWDLMDENDSILPALRLSYYYLPPYLKRCFGYCSIFPKDYEFDENKLIKLWIAEGFVLQEGKTRMEDIGGGYFRDLFGRSFFQQSSGNKSRFVMHDLINDLAQFVSRDICFRVDDKMKDNMAYPKPARHSSFLRAQQCDSIARFQPFYEVTCLRTFLPLDSSRNFWPRFLPNEIPHKLISKLECLRVLCLSSYVIDEFPDSIGNLKHLRYLDLSYNRCLKRLPESMSNLYNLQTLLLTDCGELIGLLEDMGNLINLRHLDISGCINLQKMPLRIGRLKFLQILPQFVMGKNSGSGIEELRDMLHLRGKLCISKLNNVINVGNATEAKLKNKEQLHDLNLGWSSYGNGVNDSRDERVEEEVLVQLQPHTNLKHLQIKFYGGTRFPSWIGNPSFSNIEGLELYGCRKCEFLPPLGQLPSLKRLVIDGMDGVKRVGREFYGSGSAKRFPSLEKLKFMNMKEWEEWSGAEQEGEEFSCLIELQMTECPKLRTFSHHFPSLVKFEIFDCGELAALPRCPSLGNSDLEEGEEFPCLRNLEISNCSKLKELPNLLPSLVELSISHGQALTVLPRIPLLRELYLKNCDAIVSQGLPQCLTTVEELTIVDCGVLTALFNGVGLQHLASIRRLEIWRCPLLVSLSNEDVGLLSKLEYLRIEGCHNLEKLPQSMIHNNMPLIDLVIEECHSLTSFPRGGLPTTLEYLVISDCINLESLPENLKNLTSLRSVAIKKCPCLVSFAEGGLPSTLNSLWIDDCMNVRSLLKSALYSLTRLNHLNILNCPSLVSFPEGDIPTTTILREVWISHCENLGSLPNWMHNLTSLRKLVLYDSPSLVSFPEGKLPINLEHLAIINCNNLEPLSEWRLHRLTSLRHLEIGGYTDVVSFPEWLLPTTITHIYVEDMPNLESLPKDLHNLTSLEELHIYRCDKLASFPEKGLPTMLLHLSILHCPMLIQRCMKKIGVDWSMIAYIPYIKIDGKNIV